MLKDPSSIQQLQCRDDESGGLHLQQSLSCTHSSGFANEEVEVSTFGAGLLSLENDQ